MSMREMAKATDTRLIPKTVRHRLYTIRDAAVYLGRSEWVVAEMVRTGKLPYVPDGKRKYVDIHDLDEYVAKNKTIALN